MGDVVSSTKATEQDGANREREALGATGANTTRGQSGGRNEKALDPELVEGGYEERGLFYERDWTRRALVS